MLANWPGVRSRTWLLAIRWKRSCDETRRDDRFLRDTWTKWIEAVVTRMFSRAEEGEVDLGEVDEFDVEQVEFFCS